MGRWGTIYREREDGGGKVSEGSHCDGDAGGVGWSERDVGVGGGGEGGDEEHRSTASVMANDRQLMRFEHLSNVCTVTCAYWMKVGG